LNKQSEDIQTVKSDLKSIQEDIKKFQIFKQEVTEDIGCVKNNMTRVHTDVTKNTKFRTDSANDFKYLYDSIQQQQLFLENLDYEKRKCNLILTGVSEDQELKEGETTAITDNDKVPLILKTIGQAEILIESITRLGKTPTEPGNHTRNRPIKLTLQNPMDRNKILAASKTLNGFKDTNMSLSKIYIKKDTHPGIRREMKRLHDVVAAERRKPENRGRNVRYEWKDRVVKIDDHIIDTYQPTFF